MAGKKREARLRADAPAIHGLKLGKKGDVDTDKPGHDDLVVAGAQMHRYCPSRSISAGACT